MQGTRNVETNEVRRELFAALNREHLLEQMQADVRPNEVVTIRKELTSDDGWRLYVECILRELMAIPEPVFERPAFAKLNRYLKGIRKFYSWKDPLPADQLPK